MLSRLFGPKVTPGRDDRKPPWSPTVIENNRRAKKRGQRALLAVGVLFLVACVVCGIGTQIARSSSKAPQAAMPQGSSMSAELTRTPPTPPPGWTAVPGQPGVSFRFATFTPRPPPIP
jgi:hypothetical protein